MKTCVPLLTALALAVACATAATAMAVPRTLTRTQVIARGSRLCKAAEQRVDRLPPIRSQHPFGPHAPKGDAARATRFLGVYASALTSVRAGFLRLDAPPQGRQLLRAFVSGLQPAIAAFERAHADAFAGRGAAAESEAQKGFASFARASVYTRRYGFPKGVCQSGASG